MFPTSGFFVCMKLPENETSDMPYDYFFSHWVHKASEEIERPNISVCYWSDHEYLPKQPCLVDSFSRKSADEYSFIGYQKKKRSNVIGQFTSWLHVGSLAIINPLELKCGISI